MRSESFGKSADLESALRNPVPGEVWTKSRLESALLMNIPLANFVWTLIQITVKQTTL
jgi:hypothetical protein